MENEKSQNGPRGFKIIIIVLAVVIAAVSILFYTNMSSMKKETAQLNADKASLQISLTEVSRELGDIKTTNEALTVSLDAERMRVDSLMKDIENSKINSKATINKYKREIDNLKSLVKKYAAQIEELNAANKRLTQENVEVKTNLKSTTLRAEAAEDDAKNLSEVVKKGQVIAAREIELTPVKKNDKETSRIRRARKLKIDFTLVANAITNPGERTIFARLIGPDGSVMTSNKGNIFEYNGENIGYTASRTIDYQNADLKVSVYLDEVKGLEKGNYTIQIYMDGLLIGTKEVPSK